MRASPDAMHSRTKQLPMKPAPPVTRMVSMYAPLDSPDRWCGCAGYGRLAFRPFEQTQQVLPIVVLHRLGKLPQLAV